LVDRLQDALAIAIVIAFGPLLRARTIHQPTDGSFVALEPPPEFHRERAFGFRAIPAVRAVIPLPQAGELVVFLQRELQQRVFVGVLAGQRLAVTLRWLGLRLVVGSNLQVRVLFEDLGEFLRRMRRNPSVGANLVVATLRRGTLVALVTVVELAASADDVLTGRANLPPRRVWILDSERVIKDFAYQPAVIGWLNGVEAVRAAVGTVLLQRRFQFRQRLQPIAVVDVLVIVDIEDHKAVARHRVDPVLALEVVVMVTRVVEA